MGVSIGKTRSRNTEKVFYLWIGLCPSYGKLIALVAGVGGVFMVTGQVFLRRMPGLKSSHSMKIAAQFACGTLVHDGVIQSPILPFCALWKFVANLFWKGYWRTTVFCMFVYLVGLGGGGVGWPWADTFNAASVHFLETGFPYERFSKDSQPSVSCLSVSHPVCSLMTD